jgi:hypothetical protein
VALTDQIAAYTDCLDIFDRAIEDRVGTRIQFKTFAEAHMFRMRLNHARVLVRRESQRVYERNDPRWGKSEYDILICRIKEDEEGFHWVYLERHGTEILVVESLDDSAPES